eukprot:530417-Amphidinium_carterae.1
MGTITWRSFRQSPTALSTCESELVGVMDAYESAKRVQVLIAAIAQVLQPPLRTRHTNIRAYKLTQAVNQGNASLG